MDLHPTQVDFVDREVLVYPMGKQGSGGGEVGVEAKGSSTEEGVCVTLILME